jgi:hypothetical protein
MVQRYLGEVRKHSGYKNYNEKNGVRIDYCWSLVQVTTEPNFLHMERK